MSDIEESFDVVIVGARCAGSATAANLARAGKRVLVLERSRYGTGTTSTHALMAPALLQLAKLGALDAIVASGAPQVRRTVFHYGSQDEVDIAIRPRPAFDGLYAPRREVLDSILVDTARNHGAEFRFGCTFLDVVWQGEQAIGLQYRDSDHRVKTVKAGWVVGADGLRSRVAHKVFAINERVAENSSSCVYAYFDTTDEGAYHWYFSEGAAAGLVPTTGNQQCVFVAASARDFDRDFRSSIASGFWRVLRQANPEFAASLAMCEQQSKFRGFAGQVGHIRQASGPGWALVGDAGYFRDPITAHGMTDALRDAEFVSDAIVDGSHQALSTFSERRQQMSERFFEISSTIAGYRWTLDELRLDHIEMSKIMRHEEEMLQQNKKSAAA